MQIIINTTPETVQDYAAYVYTGITEGETSGHYDAENNWTIIPDSQTAAITEQITAYLDPSNSENLPEADVAAWQAIDSLCRALGIPMPRGTQNAEIYTEEEVLKQERNGML